METPAIDIKGLTKSYGELKALNGVNISIKKGEFFGLLGPNGAGKTTTINILTGLVFKESGSTKVFGKDTIKDFRYTRSKIGIAAQEFSVDWFFPIEKLLFFQAGYYGIKPKDAKPLVDSLLNRLGLSSKRNSRLRQLSGGMKRRFQIAKALVHDPEILILDEPTAGVDVELRRDLWKYLQDLHSRGKTILLTTHYIEEAEAIADRVGVINQGEIIVVDETQQLLKKMGHKKLTVELQDKILEIPSSLEKYNLSIGSNMVSLNYTYNVQAKRTGITNLLQDLKDAGLKLKDLKTEQSTLEKIFVSLVREKNEN